MRCWSSGSDDYFGSINDDSCGGILLEELRHMCLNEFSRRPQRDLLELQIEEINPACEDLGRQWTETHQNDMLCPVPATQSEGRPE